MGRTYEVLRRYEKENEKIFPATVIKNQEKTVGPELKRFESFSREPTEIDRYQQIKTMLLTRYAAENPRTLLITGSGHQTGVTTTAVGFASTLARDFQLNVLLIDVNFRCPNLHNLFGIEYRNGISYLISNKEDINPTFHKIGNGSLHVVTCGTRQNGPLTLFESNQFEDFIKFVRSRYSYVILDAPPVTLYPDPIVLSSKVDGVLLVLESGKTRRRGAIKAKQELEESGGNILGVILNKRKHYIPEWIYNRL